MHYYEKTFDLRRLDSVDLIAVYWMGDAIAHIIMSFGFQGKDFVAFSIETRKEKGEGYSTIKGFFKQYELIYIAGDERDLIRVTTDFRNPQEDVYLYRVRFNRDRAQKLFMEYIRQINAMKKKKAELVLAEHLPEQVVQEEVNDDVPGLSVETVQQAMEMLPEGYRVVFSLYLLEGYDHAEISQIMGISEATSKSQYSRAKQRIKEIIQNQQYARQV